MKIIIFDASTLISLAMNGLFEEFRALRKVFKGRFIITKEVKHEAIDRPLTIKRFELEALRLKKLVDDKILELPATLGIKDEEIAKKGEEIINIANDTFYSHNKEIKILDMGEVSCLALSSILNKKAMKNVLAVDERTMRMLVEKPENLDELLQRKLHTKIKSKKANFKLFKEFKVIRSAELVYVAYKRGIIKLKGEVVLDALLYAVKFKGCSISGDEIEEIKRMR